MTDHDNDIDALLAYLETVPRPDLRANLTALIAECDCLRSERQMYWRIKNELIVELAAAQKQRDEAYGLVAKWKEWLVDTFEHDVIGTYAKAKSNCMCDVSESDKRALLAATAKEGGGA